MEPITLLNLVVIASPFLAFFIGIIIRKFALPKRDSPSILQQLLLGIPICLIVVGPLLPIVQSSATSASLTAFLVTLGVIMEHGMIVPETAASHLNKLRKQNSPQKGS
jgi:hypothetical protein